MKIFRSKSFKRDFKELPKTIRRRAEKAFRFLIMNPRHPSLQIKKMGGQRDLENRAIWEARLTKDYRFTFAVDKSSDMYIFYRVGTHDILRNPL